MWHTMRLTKFFDDQIKVYLDFLMLKYRIILGVYALIPQFYQWLISGG